MKPCKWVFQVANVWKPSRWFPERKWCEETTQRPTIVIAHQSLGSGIACKPRLESKPHWAPSVTRRRRPSNLIFAVDGLRMPTICVLRKAGRLGERSAMGLPSRFAVGIIATLIR